MLRFGAPKKCALYPKQSAISLRFPTLSGNYKDQMTDYSKEDNRDISEQSGKRKQMISGIPMVLLVHTLFPLILYVSKL